MSLGADQLSRGGQQEGTLGSYLQAIRAHPAVVALITLAAVAASVAFLALRDPSYEATAELLVEPLGQEDQTFYGLPLVRDTGDPVRTAQTAAALIETRAAAELTAERFGGGLSDQEILDQRITVTPQGESNIIGITATAPTAGEAARLANEFARASLDVRADNLRAPAQTLAGQLEARLRAAPQTDSVTRAELVGRLDQVRSVIDNGDPTLLLAQETVPPTSASGTPAPLIVVLALVAGLVLGSGTAMLLELLTRRVRDEEEATRLYPIPALARVPVLPPRSRRGPPGSTWYMPPEIREPFRTLTVQLEQRGRPLATVMVTSPSKGDGKTTSAINLAVSLAATGKRVVVLDFDLRNPQVAAGLRIENGHRVTDLLDPKLDLAKLLVRPSELRTLSVLPVRFDPDDAHLSDSLAWRLPEFIEQARGMADYVIVDTPPLGEVSDALMLARVVDDILVVMRPGNTNRGHLAVTRELLERIGLTPEGCIIIGISERPGRGYRAYGYGPGGAPDLVLRNGVASTRRRSRALRGE